MRISRKATNDQPLRLDQRKFRATAAAVIVAMLAGAAVLPLAPPSRFSRFANVRFEERDRASLSVLRRNASDSSLATRRPRSRALPQRSRAACRRHVCDGRSGAWDGRQCAAARSAIGMPLLRRLRSLLPIMAALLCIYWLVHLMNALRGPKSELVDLENPIARTIHKRFSRPRCMSKIGKPGYSHFSRKRARRKFM